jgi:hypothetical protein
MTFIKPGDVIDFTGSAANEDGEPALLSNVRMSVVDHIYGAPGIEDHYCLRDLNFDRDYTVSYNELDDAEITVVMEYERGSE